MPSCLGLYIENNLIKYAKVSKEREAIKVEAFGIKFYDKLNEAIKQIISETYSFKIPISVNLSQEMYNYFYMFSLINKKDMQKAVETEFSSYCTDQGINENSLESRYVLVNSFEDKEKIKVIHVSANKMEINRRLQQLEGNRLTTISPLSISISNLVDFKPKENILIVNIENKTTITKIIDGKLYDVVNLDQGSSDILAQINERENSFSKAYEICKNSTIYTMEGKELQEEENLYLEQIMPTLYNIATQVKEITDESLSKIDKIYLTGTACVISNIDLYFQEYLRTTKCEILKPYFINELVAKVNIKDYIEVNSAIALALQGLGEGIKGMNFKKQTLSDKLPDFFGGSSEKSNENGKKSKSGKFNLRNDLGEQLDRTERGLITFAIGILIIILTYSGFSITLEHMYDAKDEEIQQYISDTQREISKVQADIDGLKESQASYEKLSRNLEEMAEKVNAINQTKNAIPTLLSQIMVRVPEAVQITAIENYSDNKIRINAQSTQYEQLGYFKSAIKTNEILYNVVSQQMYKEGDVVKTVIEGELP